MPEKFSEVDDVVWGSNEAYNIRENENVTWDRNENLEILIDSCVICNIPRRE